MSPLNLTDIPEKEITPLVSLLLETIQGQAEQIQFLRDEIARLKNHKPKPEIKPSNLEKKTENKNGKRGVPKKKKTKKLKIHRVKKCRPDNIPEGSRFIGYQDFIVQDIEISNLNTKYRRARYRTPDGEFIVGRLPEEVGGHFGPALTSFILHQYYDCHVTRPLIAEELDELGVHISAGQINNILTLNKDDFHKEKAEILSAALKNSDYINVDDTGARHKGVNGYCTHIGNEYFAWFETAGSKSRINFLKLLRAENRDFIINDDALEYMASHGLPKFQLAKFSELEVNVFRDDGQWSSLLDELDVSSANHVRIATEGALVGSIIRHGFNTDMAIISDDAGQFNVFLHGLCWVHAERSIHKLIGHGGKRSELLETTRSDIWNFYKGLKSYRESPTETAKLELEERFDELFTRKTGFATLDNALKRIHKNKSELLLVLERPDIPLHNNLSESDIREYVKRRKVSGSTRSEEGKKCRDTFTSLKKTCRKLGVSFLEYLQDRIGLKNRIPPLSELMKLKMSQSET